MGDFGYTQALWFKESAAYGSVETMSSGTRYILPVKPANAKKTINRIKTEHIRGVAGMKTEEDQLGEESVELTFEFAVPCNGDFAFLLKHLTGKITSTGPSGTKYTHTALWNDKMFVGLSFAHNKAGKTYVYHGCQIKSMKLSVKVGGPLTGSITIVGSKEEQLALQTAPAIPTLATGTPYYLFQHGAFTIDGAAEAITEAEITFERTLAESLEESYVIGSVSRALLPSYGFGATGVIKRRHDNDSTHVSKFYAKYLAGTTGAVVLTFTSPTDADFTFIVTLGVVKFEGETPNYENTSWIKENAPFTAYNMDAATATSSLVLTDKSNQAFAATGAYDGAGA